MAVAIAACNFAASLFCYSFAIVPFTLDAFTKWRPFLFHITSVNNVAAIRSARCLQCADVILKSSRERSLLREHRKSSCIVHSGNAAIRLQSQAPLHAGNIAFDKNWTLNGLIEYLNGFVFFWPGTEAGPCNYGRNHFASSSWDRHPINVLRIPAATVFSPESCNRPYFCRFNSGAPRCYNGRQSPRGRNTFLPHDEFDGTLARVAEVVFRGGVALPDKTELASSPDGPWKPFF